MRTHRPGAWQSPPFTEHMVCARLSAKHKPSVVLYSPGLCEVGTGATYILQMKKLKLIEVK